MFPKLIFFGTPEIAAHTLSELINNFDVIAVVTQPDKPSGRKKTMEESPVKKIALEHGIKIFQPERLTQIENDISIFRPDLGIVFAYSKIIPKKIIDIFPKGILNIHPSLLPKYRGPSPVQAAIANGEKETGVSIIVIDKNLDHGHILCQEKITIQADETARDLLKKLAERGTEILIHSIPKYISGELKPRPQDHTQATFTKIINREDGRIDWDKSAEKIYCQFRAYHPWPGIYTTFDNKRLKMLKLKVAKNNVGQKQKPGAPFLTLNKELAIKCGQDSILIHEVQLEGKKPTTSKNFILGYKNFLNALLI